MILISGRIRVTSQKSKEVLYLNAGEECSFDPASSVLCINKTLLTKPVPGKKGSSKTSILVANEMIFNKTSLQDVFRKIEAIYPVHIVFSAERSDSRTFTGSFTKSKTPDEALETIALLNDLEIRKAGDTIYLRKK